MWGGQISPYEERNLDFEDSKLGPSPYTGEEDEKKRGAVLDMTNESEEVSKWEKLFDVLSYSKLMYEDDWYDTYCICERILCVRYHTCLHVFAILQLPLLPSHLHCYYFTRNSSFISLHCTHSFYDTFLPYSSPLIINMFFHFSMHKLPSINLYHMPPQDYSEDEYDKGGCGRPKKHPIQHLDPSVKSDGELVRGCYE